MERAAALQESLQNEKRWRNVQGVLLETFTDVADVLHEQIELIQTLQRRVDELEKREVVTVEHVAASEERVRVEAKRRVARLRKEVSASLEMTTTSKQVEDKVETRVRDAVLEVERSLETRCGPVEDAMNRFTDRVDSKIAAQNAVLSVQDVKIEELQLTADRQKEQAALVTEQVTLMKTQQSLDNDKSTKVYQELLKQVDGLKAQVAKIEAREAAVLQPAKEVTATPEEQETDVDAIHKDLARVSEGLHQVETQMEKRLVKWRQELVTSIGNKLCKSEASKLLTRKMDTMDAWKQLAEKADSARVEEIAGALMDTIQRSQENTLDELEQIRRLHEGKADAFELVQVKHNVHNLVAVAESIQHELSSLKRVACEKMSVADAKELIESQATLTGLQQAMEQVECAAADEFATKRQLDTVAQQVQGIMRQLRSEIYQARYIWKEGRPSSKQTIQWTSQVVNTNADIFLWQVGSDEVRLLLPGLYHLQAAFFTSHSPTVQVLVNGEPAFVLRSSSHNVNDARTGLPVVRRLHHSAGNVGGLGVDVFLALPARTLVSISYDLDEKAQGFLNLRKL